MFGGVVLYSDTSISWNTSVKEKLENNFTNLKEWHDRYLKVFETNLKYGSGSYLQKLKVKASDIEWRILCKNIGLTNCGVVYFNRDVEEKEKIQHIETLIKQGVIREMRPQEKGFFSLALFLKQAKE